MSCRPELTSSIFLLRLKETAERRENKNHCTSLFSDYTLKIEQVNKAQKTIFSNPQNKKINAR
jgi:hypothetical protein